MPDWLQQVLFADLIPALCVGVAAAFGSYTGWWFWAKRSARLQREFTDHVDKTIKGWLSAD